MLIKMKVTIKASITICSLLLGSIILPLLKIEPSLTQELSAEDQACISAAVDRLPRVDALKFEGSRIVMSQPAHQGRDKVYPYNAMVEIDVNLAGQKQTHTFFCFGDTIWMVAQPLEMR